jgi:hypothetical protein
MHIKENTYTVIIYFISLTILENYRKAKTFCVQCFDDNGNPLKKFERYTMSNNEDFWYFLGREGTTGLVNIDDNHKEPRIITSLEYIQHNKYYTVADNSDRML